MECIKCKENGTETAVYNEEIAKCNHKFCKKCLYEHIQGVGLESKIKCSVENCEQFIYDRVYREFLSKSQIIQYEKHCADLPKCLTAFCPYEFKCLGINFFVCKICDQPNCLICQKQHRYPNGCYKDPIIEVNKEIKSKIKNEITKQMENFEMSEDILSCFDAFDCDICMEFKLPLEGYLLHCGDSICKDCMDNWLKGNKPKHKSQFYCPLCKEIFNEMELKYFAEDDVLINIQTEKKQNLFSCKEINCDSEFFVGNENKKSTVKCPKCKTNNCINCEVVHKKNETCEQYKQSEAYKTLDCCRKSLQSVNCYSCNKLIVKKSGCNAISCDVCNVSTCFFLRVKVGPGGCECHPRKTCHDDCKYGCFVELK